jgi:uncharacterized protein (TIGR00296 family)
LPMSPEEGRFAVRLAREALEGHVDSRRSAAATLDSGLFLEARGVFVTLNATSPGGNSLRGCIGFPFPVKRLGEAIREAAIAAASEDPRFPPVTRVELDSILVEVSVLTPPEDLEAPKKELPSHVQIGRDGLLVSNSHSSGLLLPQVATEFGMDQLEFLSQACMKAGLPPDAWLLPRTRVQVFQAEVFTEKSPRGEVVSVSGEGP